MTKKQILKDHILYLRNQYHNEVDQNERARLSATHARLMVAYLEIFGEVCE